jgi:hypothetical protein
MCKLAGAVSAIVLAAIGAGIWSSPGTAAGPIAAHDSARLIELTAATTAADRFPREAESSRAFALIQSPDAADRGASVAAGRNDRQALVPGCAQSNWPFIAQQCLTPPKAPAVRAAPRPATERRSGEHASRRAAAAPAAAATPTAASASAAPANGAPACKQNLATAMARVERALAHVKGLRDRADACTTYRQNFFDLVQAREVAALCKTGAERDQELGRIDLAVEDINGAIAKSCGS